jgi:heat shock protein HslJ
MSIRSTITAGVVALALISSAPAVFAHEATPTVSSDLTSWVWELVEFQTGPNSSTKPDNPGDYTVDFHDDGTVTIQADCNVALGTYTIDGDRIDIEVGPMTMAMCDEDSLSNQWIDDIDQAVSYSINEDGQLSLNLPADAGFVRLAPSLLGVVWEWTGIQSMDGTITTIDDPSRYTIEFMADGSFALGADCNRGRGDYSRDGSSIDLTVGALTRAMCEPESRSNDFLGYVDAVSSLVFLDGSLHLALPMDGGILSFTPEALDPVASPQAGA